MPGSDLDLRGYFEVATKEESPGEAIRERILRLESWMNTLEQADLPVNHHFAKGQYARELFIPKGVCLIGKIHKCEHLNIISKGDITVLTETGMKRIIAPYTFVSRPGTKRVGLAHADTVWVTIHATEETDLEKIEEEVIAASYEGLDGAASANPKTLTGGA